MECPKCGAEIDKGALVCPNCKKVLKIICPVCRTVNEKNICRKCGEILVTKCIKCGKINLMKNQKCVKCGYSTELSALQNESNTETFAVIKIEFPNLDVIRTALGSNQLYMKFKSNLDNMINNYVKTLGVRRQIIKNSIYILRFNTVYTFSASANAAIEAVIELANLITRLNYKLLEKKNVSLKTNFSIIKRDSDKNPYNIETGFQANMLNQEEDKDKKALDSCQVITDDDFYELYNDKYVLESLDSVLVDGKMKRFYEINIKSLIRIDDFIKEGKIEKQAEENEVPTFINEAMSAQENISANTIAENIAAAEGEDLYNIDLINFDAINCAFYTTENNLVFNNIVDVLQEIPRGIVAIKAAGIYQPNVLKLLSVVDELGIYQNIIPITCHKNMKYEPYAFFRELISSIFDYSVSSKLINQNDYSMFDTIGQTDLVKDLMSLNQRDISNSMETRQQFFEVFASMLQAIPDTLLFIENFENMDSMSQNILYQLFANFDQLGISYMISYDKEFSLHKNAHFLLSNRSYTEITLKPAPIANVIGLNQDFYKNILSDFYFKSILKYSLGSNLYLDHAVQYLVESGVYEYTESSIELINPKTTVIPATLDLLLQRRLNLMKDEGDLFRFLAMTVLIAPRVDVRTIELLGIQNWQSLAEILGQRGYLYTYNGSVYFPNYVLLKDCILEVISQNELIEISNILLNNVFEQNIPCVVKAYLTDNLNDHQQAIYEWEKLANVALSMGDFGAYINCSSNIIKSLDKYSHEWTGDDLAKYKASIYENIANNMFEFNPNQAREVADKTLEDLLNTKNIKSYIDLSIKMIQGAMLQGEYLYALNLTHKLLNVMQGGSINPLDKNFDMTLLLLTIIHVKILFNNGSYNDCLDIGYNILNVLDSSKIENLKFDIISNEEFKFMISECIGYMAMSVIFTFRNDVNEFLDTVNKLFNFIPSEYSVFVQLQKLYKGEAVSIANVVKGENLFSNLLFYIISAFTDYKGSPDAFAKEIYKAKIVARDTYMTKFEFFADLMIGYSYANKNSYVKASAIVNQVVKSAKEKGFMSIVFVANYIMSLMNIKQGKLDIAYGIINNSLIQIEKMNSANEYLTMLFKVCLFKVFSARGENDMALSCKNQAKHIIEKYNLNFNLDS